MHPVSSSVQKVTHSNNGRYRAVGARRAGGRSGGDDRLEQRPGRGTGESVEDAQAPDVRVGGPVSNCLEPDPSTPMKLATEPRERQNDLTVQIGNFNSASSLRFVGGAVHQVGRRQRGQRAVDGCRCETPCGRTPFPNGDPVSTRGTGRAHRSGGLVFVPFPMEVQ